MARANINIHKGGPQYLQNQAGLWNCAAIPQESGVDFFNQTLSNCKKIENKEEKSLEFILYKVFSVSDINVV